MQRRRITNDYPDNKGNMETKPQPMCPPGTPEQELYDQINRKHEIRKPVRKRHRIIGTYFTICGIAANVIVLVWLIVRLLVYIQTFAPQA